jgi:hypothetical protein
MSVGSAHDVSSLQLQGSAFTINALQRYMYDVGVMQTHVAKRMS